MKKIFFTILFSSVILNAFSDVKCRVYHFTTFGTTNVSYNTQSTLSSIDQLPSLFYNSEFGILLSLTSGRVGIISPSLANQQIGESSLFNMQISTNGNRFVLSPMLFPSLQSLFVGIQSLVASGYSGTGLTEFYRTNNRIGYNVNYPVLVSDVLSSTNTTYRQLLFSSLASINSSIQNINVDLGQFQRDYQSVNYGVLNVSNYIDSAVSRGFISFYQGEIYKGDIASAFREPDTYGDPLNFARSVFDTLKDRETAANSADYINDNPHSLNEFAKQFGNSFSAAGAGHFTTPLTNEMQRMSTNWVQETKAALSNNTQKIKDDLQAWKDMLSGPNGSQAAIVSALNGAMNNTGAFKVELQNANNSVYVHLDGPITLDSAQFQDVNNKLQANFDIFHDWVYAIPESWVRYFNMFRDNTTSVLTNQTVQISLLSSLTNLLFEYSFNFTSNTMFAISNSFAGLSFTNQYLLLSDYQTFVDSSKYNDIISSLPSDLSSALSSYGFSNSSDYSGRWWAFITANSAYQSTLLSTNAALASVLLSSLEQIDDDEEGSLLSRWLSLIDSIPDPEEIQQSLNEATNIVSNIGFDRVDTLYSTATQDLVSVVKGIYQDKRLPDNIRFVFIPAAQGREEKFVDIPVGEHSSFWSLFRSGMAFALSVVTLLLFPKYVSWLVAHYTRLVERIIKSLHAYTHQ